jgi:hypothetical protein
MLDNSVIAALRAQTRPESAVSPNAPTMRASTLPQGFEFLDHDLGAPNLQPEAVKPKTRV